MAQNKMDDYDITLVHGSEKHSFQLPSTSKLADLQTVVEDVTGVPVHSQRLICNGRNLTSVHPLLKSLPETHSEPKSTALTVPRKAKILLLGQRPEKEEESAAAKVIQNNNKLFDEITCRVNTISKDIDDIEKGFSPKELIHKSVPKLDKQTRIAVEELMKMLEHLDGVELNPSQKEARAQRKNLIDRVQRLLDSSDSMLNSIKTIREKHDL